MLQPNELMTWDEMVEKYPSRWVFVEQTKGDLSNIEAGFVRFVVTDDEIAVAIRECKRAGLDCVRQRTTVEPFMGIVDGVNFSISAEEILESENKRGC